MTKGARIAAFFWIQSLVRADDCRSMLTELDDVIRTLRVEAPDNPAVLRLTGLYHNLLRHWANT